MRFESHVESLAKAVAAAKNACGSAQRIILLIADEKGASVTGADGTLQIGHRFSARNIQPGGCAIDANDFVNITKSLGKTDVITIDTQNDQLKIQCGRSKLTLPILDGSGFPGFGTEESAAKAIPVEGQQWCTAFNACVTVCGNEQTQQEILRGIHVVGEENKIRISGTDGFRASTILLDAEINLPHQGIIIPARAAKEIARIGINQPLHLFASETFLFAQAGNQQILARLIEGTYPPMSRLITTREETTILVPKEEFIGAITRVRSVLDRTPILKIETTEEGLLLSATRDARTAEELVPLESCPKEIVFGVNAQFMGDALRTTNGSVISLGIVDENNMIRVTDPSEQNLLHLIMPARV